MTLARLISALDQAGIDLDPSAILDALWLASQANPLGSQLTQSPRLPASPGQPGQPQPAPSPGFAGFLSPSLPSPADTVKRVVFSEIVGLYSNAQRDGTGRQASPVAAPAANALPERLAFMRAIRPLKQRWKSTRAFDVDEEATAHLTADCRLTGRQPLMPVLRLRQERWFDVDLVLEDDEAVELWRDTLKALAQTMSDTGAFRVVREWRLRIPEERTPGARPREMLESAGGGLFPAAILGGAERRVILFAHHASSRHWRSGAYARLLGAWSRDASVALLNLLPSGSWIRTPLGEADGRCSTYRPGVNNRLLDVHENWWSARAGDGNAVAYPMVALDPKALGEWASMLMARGRSAPVALLREPSTRQTERAARAADPRDGTQRRIDLLQEAAPGAFRLATLLSTSPFTIPVLRLIQEAHFGRVDLAELSELFVSGLVVSKRLDTGASSGWFEILPNARTLLLRRLRGADARSIAAALVKRVSEHIETRTGLAPEGTSFTPDAAGRFSLPAWAEPYAVVASMLRPTAPQPNPLAFITALKEARSRAIRTLARLAASDAQLEDAVLDPMVRDLITMGGLAPAVDGGPLRFLDEVRAKLKEIDEAQPLLGANILWVDDNPHNNTFICREFEEDGALIVEALNTEEAMARYSDNFDIIISDMGRREGPREGFTLLRALRARDSATHVIVFAGGYAAAQKRRNEAISAGAYGCTNDVGELRAFVHELYRQPAGVFRSPAEPSPWPPPGAEAETLFDHSRDLGLIVHQADEDRLYGRSAVAFEALLRDRLKVPASRIRRQDLDSGLAQDDVYAFLRAPDAMDSPRQGTAFLYAAGPMRASGPGEIVLVGSDRSQSFPIEALARQLRADSRFAQVIMVAEGAVDRVTDMPWPVNLPLHSAITGNEPVPLLSITALRNSKSVAPAKFDESPTVLPVVRRLIAMVEELGEGHVLRSEDIVQQMRELSPDVVTKLEPAHGGVRLGLGEPALPVLRPWGEYFAYGVKQANLRGGEETDGLALEAYQRALSFATDSLSNDARAQITVYAGAMLKRLGQCEEAEALLTGTEELWMKSSWRDDALYNLAGVYALRQKRAPMLRLLRGLSKNNPTLLRVRRALQTYFRNYADDPELLNLLRPDPTRPKQA